MTLEHDTGVLRGTVLQGQFEGRLLEEMSVEEIVALLHECRVNDPQSADVIETYLDRVHGAEWRGDSGGGDAGAAAGDGSMTPAQAYEILGLQPGASDDDIREAHRTLFESQPPGSRRLHLAGRPDQPCQGSVAAQRVKFFDFAVAAYRIACIP